MTFGGIFIVNKSFEGGQGHLDISRGEKLSKIQYFRPIAAVTAVINKTSEFEFISLLRLTTLCHCLWAV